MNKKPYTFVGDLPNEEWRSIAGAPPHFKVSNLGRVKRVYPHKDILYKPQDNGLGYKNVVLSLGSLKAGSLKKGVHVLVANAFIPNPNNLPEVNHINHIPSDNAVGNLEWVTHAENLEAARVFHGNWNVRGEETGSSILKEAEVLEIIKTLKENPRVSVPKLAKKYNISSDSIHAIRKGVWWKHLNSEVLPQEVIHGKLVPEQVSEIKKLLSQGVKAPRIASIFNVDSSTIYLISWGKTWKDIK